ncbi:radical SAM protein [Chloroflexota bacterium]
MAENTMPRLELPPYRPPSEAGSLLVRVTRNCPWNRCTFCSMYKGEKFELRSVEEVKQDILALKAITEGVKEWAWKNEVGGQVGQAARANGICWLDDEGQVKSAFIGDSNSIIMRTEELAIIIEFLYQTFPTLERVTSYGRAHTVLRKKPEELKRLELAGLSRLHLGLETGDDELLAYVQKGSTADQMIEAGRKVKESGISLSEYVLLGLGGSDRWEQHAMGTAKVLNAINPDFIRVRTLILRPESPLWQNKEQGEFKLSSPEKILMETRLLIENLDVTSQFVSDHVSNYLSLDGTLPQDKDALLKRIDTVLETPPEIRRGIVQPESLRHL